MKSTAFLLISFVFLLCGCESEKAPLHPSDVIRSITAHVQEDNALRVDIGIDFKQPVDYSVSYWKPGDEERARNTEPLAAEGKHTTTLIFLEPDTEYCFRILVKTDTDTIESDTYIFRTLLAGRNPSV